MQEVLHFYSERDTVNITPELAVNGDNDELGAPGLTAMEMTDIITLLKILADVHSE